MVRIAVCEDDPKALSHLAEMVDSVCTTEHSVICFESSAQLLEYTDCYNDGGINIVVSDIEMPGMNGVEMARLLRSKYPGMQFVFVTNYTDYIEDVFAVDPVYYILKPADSVKLAEALGKAIKRIADNENNCLTIMRNTKLVRAKYSEIMYAESDKRVVNLHLVNSLLQVNMKLDELSEKLPDNFLRIHKSYVVNMNFISTISNNSLVLLNGAVVPVAKAKYSDVKKEVFRFLGEKL